MKRLWLKLQQVNQKQLRVENKIALALEAFCFGFMAFLCFLEAIHWPIALVNIRTKPLPPLDLVAISFFAFPLVKFLLSLLAIIGVGAWAISVIHKELNKPNDHERRIQELQERIAEYENGMKKEV